MNNNVQLSHVLYRVQDLHTAVKKIQDAGFIVEYGTDPDKAYNALIWFEKGGFIEIYHNSGLPGYIKWMMKIFGYQSVLERMRQWENVKEGWCEWSLESTLENLNSEKQFFKNENIGFRFHKAKRKDVYGNKLTWELLMPDDIDFPFLMSAYLPDPRPKEVSHPNGIVGVRSIKVGTDLLNTQVLNQLLINQEGLELVQGKGLQTVEFINSDLKIENIL
ncbi:VOC family protein [Chryseobacterium sp. Marseille-Q3244]|uniref:VOC family protein n=1 Tax=Chryseobacterium sp. Marseille-Q3244 TaxID=2758092 RepID=UPI002024F8DA|nr:VOC family protein [Chryseobacterium sp. Marseille-Q3244]